jgi:radical SAM protein with 4Fe4S-binding SPASM domain
MTDQTIQRMLRFPSTVHIESTNSCNASCNMCPVPHLKRPRTLLSDELFDKVVRECSAHPDGGTIHLHQNGEFLLLGPEKVYQRLSHAVKTCPQWKVGFFTNGALMDVTMANRVLDAHPSHIVFSIDGGIKDDYERIRGLSFETVYANVKYFFEERQRRGMVNPTISIMLVPQVHNENHLAEYFGTFKPFADHVGASGAQNFGGLVDNKSILHRGQFTGGKRDRPCPRVWNDMYINSDGNAALCCFDAEGAVILGDFRKQTLQEIWWGTLLRKYRRWQLQGRHNELLLCSVCDVMEGTCEAGWGVQDRADLSAALDRQEVENV